MIQKPPPLRALSQLYHPSPSTKRNENYVDLSLEGPESVHGRCVESDGSATTPSRISGSRLKLELSRDLNDAAQHNDFPNPHESPQESQLLRPVSRGRPKFQFQGNRPQLQGASDVPLLSSIRGGENITAQMSLPMPRRPSQNVRCSPRERAPPASVLKKDARPKPYILEVPSAAPRCPPNGRLSLYMRKI
jgi:mediator of RNA polymerase II transcription subunit 12, fungi type